MPELSTENPSQILLEADNLRRFHGEQCVVNDVSLQLHRGEVLGLLGLNGAGKSSTLKMLSGIMAPSSGEVSICGHSMRHTPLLAKQHLGYLPENPPLYLDMRVDDYLRFAARLRGLGKKQIKTALEKVKVDCNLTDVGRRIIGNLSKGYRQRVGLAQALIHQPAVIILDEPSSGFDPQQMTEMRNLILRLAPQHGIIFSTHLLGEATAICSHVCVIHQGRVVNRQTLTENASDDITLLNLKVREPINNVDLLRLPGVINAKSKPEQRWCLSVQASQQNQLLSKIVERGLHVVEFGPEKHELETLFNDLLQHDEVARSNPIDQVKPASAQTPSSSIAVSDSAKSADTRSADNRRSSSAETV